jgi:hypothetical protein
LSLDACEYKFAGTALCVEFLDADKLNGKGKGKYLAFHTWGMHAANDVRKTHLIPEPVGWYQVREF